MIPIKTRTTQTIAKATDETTPTTNDHNSADENQMRQPNHDGQDITDSNAKKDDGIDKENLMIFKYRQSDHKDVTTAEKNHPQFEESEAKQTDKKRDENKKIQVGIKFKKTRSYKNSMRQSDDAGKATASSNYPQVEASVTKQKKKEKNRTKLVKIDPILMDTNMFLRLT
ncbi:hypothetical protein QYM36_007708 [Artemia franciscana]|uniref:Uncharacterized protein n=1 Tax=Artemia franciscana TaxID=6661 RepID=A0AA88LHB5_ARTSF|nr:hypothetical protein QYM36_007708 [Artemia franciscana]